jgi:hypothetical protein
MIEKQHEDKLFARLEKATARMAALEEEVEALRLRLANRDLPAINLGARRIVEALLRHACRVENVSVSNQPPIQEMTDSLKNKGKTRIEKEFWTWIKNVQDTGNLNSHFQHDNVYVRAMERRSQSQDLVIQVLLPLANAAELFVRYWPPPVNLLPIESEPEEADPAIEAARVEASTAVRPAKVGTNRSARPSPSPKLDAPTVRAMTVTQAKGSPEVRRWLSTSSGLAPASVTRRLNHSHGAMKIRNLFPSAFEDAPETEEEVALDHFTIGELNVKQARDLEVAEDIAVLTGASVATVRRKLNTLHGASVIRRNFPWYDTEVIGELTVSTARRYNMAVLLAAGLERTRSTVQRKLTAAAGQTKLRTVFPELDRA